MSTRNIVIAVIAVALIAFPLVGDPFLVSAIGVKSLWLGTVAASLTFLVRYGGMVTLAQTAVYGTAGYVVAILSVTYKFDPYIAALFGVLAGTILAGLIGLIAARTHGIYFLMLTLAAGVFVFYFALQDTMFTNGHGGINGVNPPEIFFDPINFYFLNLAVAAISLIVMLWWTRRPVGIALQGVRDSGPRMQSLGYSPATIRVIAMIFAGVIASLGGVMSVWFNGRISPGSIDLTRTFDVLIVAVLGGLVRIEGAWLGALIVTLLANYASDFTDRYNTAIGVIFVIVVILSPNGALGLPRAIYNGFQKLRSKGTKNLAGAQAPTS